MIVLAVDSKYKDFSSYCYLVHKKIERQIYIQFFIWWTTQGVLFTGVLKDKWSARLFVFQVLTVILVIQTLVSAIDINH